MKEHSRGKGDCYTEERDDGNKGKIKDIFSIAYLHAYRKPSSENTQQQVEVSNQGANFFFADVSPQYAIFQLINMHEALIRFRQDICAVGRGTLNLQRIRRCTLKCATLAFQNAGDPQHGTWVELVILVARLLAHREKSPSGSDTQERARLQLFVQENSDVFEVFKVWIA